MDQEQGRLYEKCGWKAVEDLPTLVRGYNVSKFIHTGNKVIDKLLTSIMNKLISTIYMIEKMVWCLSKSRLSIEEIELFDDRITDFFHSVKNHYPYIAHRTKDVLNWKYSHSPFTEYFKVICTKDSEVIGYMVSRTKKMKDGRSFGTIIDFLCAPAREDIFTALLRSSILKMEKENVDYIDILMTVKSYKKNLLKMVIEY